MSTQHPGITTNPKDLSSVFKIEEPLNLGDRLKELRDKRKLEDKRTNRKNWDGVDAKLVEKIEELEGHSQYLRTEEQAIDQKKEQLLFRQRHQLKAATKTMADKLSSVISSEKDKLLDVFERQLNESRVPKSPANSFYTNSRLNRTANSLDRSASQMLNVSLSSASNQQQQYALIHRYFKDPQQQSQSSTNILLNQSNNNTHNSMNLNTTQSVPEGQENHKMHLQLRQRNKSCSETCLNQSNYAKSNSSIQRDQLIKSNVTCKYLETAKQVKEASNSSDKQKNTISIETIRQTSNFPYQNYQQTLDISNQKATWRQRSLEQEIYLKNATVDITSNVKTLSNGRHLEQDSELTSFRQGNAKQRCATTTPSAEEYSEYPQELRDCTNHTTVHSINDHSNNKYDSSQHSHSAANFTSLWTPFEGDNRKLSNASSSFRTASGITKNHQHYNNCSNDMGFAEKDTLSFSNHAMEPKQFQYLQKDNSLQTSTNSSKNNHNLSTQFRLSDIADTKKSFSKNEKKKEEYLCCQEFQESSSVCQSQKQQYLSRISHLERQVLKLKIALKTQQKSSRIDHNPKNKHKNKLYLSNTPAGTTKQVVSLQEENTRLKLENQKQKAALCAYSEQLESLFESIFANEKELKQLRKTQKSNNKDIDETIQAELILAQATADFKDQVHHTIKSYSDRLNVINSQEKYFQQLQQENILLKESRDLVLSKMAR